MAKKTLIVRLLCTLDTGTEKWGPGECPTLPETEALDLVGMGLAERVETPKKARSAKTPGEQQPSSGEQAESGRTVDGAGEAATPRPDIQSETGDDSGETSARGEGDESNG